MNENEIISFEDRAYQNPTVSRDEQLAFINTLREAQAQNTAQINADTYALGSQLPSSLGGLAGAEDTFKARYQTPQTDQAVANLRLAAQESALNAALSNLQNAYKKRYNDAILNYQKRSAATNPTTTKDPYEGDVETKSPDQYKVQDSISGEFPNTNNTGLTPSIIRDPATGEVITVWLDKNGNIVKRNATVGDHAGALSTRVPGMPVDISNWFKVGGNRVSLSGGGW